MNKKNMPYQPKDAKINLSIDKEIVNLELNGASEDLGFLLASAIEANPPFLKVLKLAIEFQEYRENYKNNNLN